MPHVSVWLALGLAYDVNIVNHIYHVCHNPTLRQVWGWNSQLQKWELKVFWDFRKFRVWSQGSKHLALKCSLYRWKGLEVHMSKMASYESFGHLQQKLWSKEGPEIKLVVWLRTTKSRESTRLWCVQVECNTSLEIS
jgi:hypothetical protein